MSKEKKALQLGMNHSTASSRLAKDILFNFIKDIPCHRCSKIMLRDNFSIEHKIPWLDSDNPKEMFFNLENVSFSHISCNSSAARRPKRNKYKKTL